MFYEAGELERIQAPVYVRMILCHRSGSNFLLFFRVLELHVDFEAFFVFFTFFGSGTPDYP